MSIVMVLLGGILGVVIHFTGRSMEMQSINMMHRIADSPFKKGIPGIPSEEVRLPFFIIQVNRKGNLVAASGDYFDLSDQQFLQQIADAALAFGKETGELKEHNLRFLSSTSPRGYTIVFSDTTTEDSTMEHLFYSCLMVFIVAMSVFLGISILLSHWVIKPVETAWNQQRQFVADASHELKTPLSVIMANAELMQGCESPETERQQYAQNILTMTYQMRSLVENMLEMARVDNGTLKIQFAPVDFTELVSNAVLSFQLLLEEKNLGLDSFLADNITIQGSEQHLYQVLDVLLDNAMKYSDPNSSVHVALTGSGRACTLSVASSGELISDEDLKNIFKRFYRIDKARTMNGSYGLGLPIAEAIVTAHKGKIWAESKDGRNTFFVQFPATGI